MRNEPSFCPAPAPSCSLTLRAMWHVLADQSYVVRAPSPRPAGLIILRTLAGNGRIEFRRDKPGFDSTPDTLLLFDQDNIARYHCDGPRWDFWWFVSDIHSEEMPLYQLMSVSRTVDEEPAYEECMRLLRRNRRPAAALASSILSERLARLLCRWDNLQQGTAAGNSVVDQAIDLMHESPGSFSAAQLAAKACLSERRFRELFRKATGRGPKAYLDAVRMALAVQILESGAMSLARCAQRLGFCDAFHLSKAFKRHTGVSPSQYVNGIR